MVLTRKQGVDVPMRVVLTLIALFVTGLAGTSAWSDSLAPGMRVIAERDREFIKRSGAETLEELLDSGIVRYFYTGGQPLLVLVDGKHYATTASDLDTLPLSAIERIQLLSGETLGKFGGGGVRGAINVIMKKDFDGFEARALTRIPGKEGGDSWQGSLFWGGEIGKGRMSVGVDVLRRQAIPSRSREFSRSEWTEGGSFEDAKNVSIGGNTVYVVQIDGGTPVERRTAALGECDPEKGYTGPLLNPYGARVDGDKGCGFAYGNTAWNTSEFEQRSTILNFDHPLPLGERSNFYLYANLGQSDSAFRYAPSVGTVRFDPTPEIMSAINEILGPNTVDSDDSYSVAHRFVGHGNRDWLTEYDEDDIVAGINGRLTSNLGYDAHISKYRLDGALRGNTFVHIDKITEEIEAGRYDLVDPFSTDTVHLQAIEDSSLQEEVDFGQDYLGAQFELEGQTFAIGNRKVAWSAGIDANSSRSHSILRFRDNEGETHDVTEVLGSGGISYSGEREGFGLYGDMLVPMTKNLDIRIAGRGDELDDVGGMRSWRLGAEYRPTESFTLRGSWGAGERSPSIASLHSSSAQDHPYVRCDPDGEDPPRSCANTVARQVTREVTGNPELEPSETERVAIGAQFRRRPLFVDVELYKLSRSGLAGLNRANWAIKNLPFCTGSQNRNCIDQDGGYITIYDSYRNITDTEITGVNTRYRAGFETDWGELVLSGAWRHVVDAELHIAGNEQRYALSRNMARVRFAAARGSLRATWTVNYRAGFRNSWNTGSFESWTGHDLELDWNKPLGFRDARITAGVFNLTDAGLTVNTADPSSTDGPTAAGWGRTFFLTVNKSF